MIERCTAGHKTGGKGNLASPSFLDARHGYAVIGAINTNAVRFSKAATKHGAF